MQLELKESNSPFWLIGAGKNGTFSGSNTNVPCYAKSIKKQKELATQIFKNNSDVLEVYSLTGVQWDNMPSGRKEELGYIKNKGKMILSKDQLNEGDYPKGVSRDPLPKKGVKTYTSVATALEGKGDEKMKLELNDENVVKEDDKKEPIDKSLTESNIVTPVGNPQMASSFVNIDVDLDHMEVSDFIVRLAQAIRSEQTSVLEYVALRSANGITNEERANIDAIIEEEKNHMVAFTTMLYKQLLTNHKQNVDGANEEFTLPTFGTEIFDNSEDGKLTESIANTVEKLAVKEVSVRMSDEYFIGNNEDGRMYHGLSTALNTIKDIITKSGEQVVIQNVTIADSKNEDVKLEDTFNSIDELINELKTDTNYDEIAYHIHEYAKTNKARALELMDKLFELERNKSPKECVDALIDDLKAENEQYKNEAAKITNVSSTMSQDQYEVEVDVNYDLDFTTKVIDNLKRTIKQSNEKTKNKKYGIAEDKDFKLGETLQFEIITLTGFEGELTENLINELCENWFKLASTPEAFIELA